MFVLKIFMQELWESVPYVYWRRGKQEEVEKWLRMANAARPRDRVETQKQKKRLRPFKPGSASAADIICSYEFLLRTLVKKLRLNVVEEATLHVLFHLWQPYQGTNSFRGPYDEVERALFESKKRKSETYKQLTKCLSVEPRFVQFVTKDEALNSPVKDEYYNKGDTYWHLVPLGKTYEARPRDILKYFKDLRPFLSEGLAHRIAQELTQLFRGEGLHRIARLPEFYVNLNWQNSNPEEEMRSFDNVEDYLRSQNAGAYGAVRRADLLDFSIIKLDEILDARGVRRGKDPTIFKLVNIFSGNFPAFRRVEHVSARRRDLKNKPKWKRYFKMRKETFA